MTQNPIYNPFIMKRGGPAFPVQIDNVASVGMTLREWYAGQALAGLLANPSNFNTEFEATVRVAYRIADYMIDQPPPSDE